MNASLDEILERVNHYKKRAHRKARAHYLTSKQETRKHFSLGVPVVILSTIVGGTIFSTISESPAVYWKVAAGLLSLAAAVLASLQTFFKFSEAAEKHRISAAGYASLERKFDLYLLRFSGWTGEREQILNALGPLIADFDKLERDSLDVPDHLYDKAVNEERQDKESI